MFHSSPSLILMHRFCVLSHRLHLTWCKQVVHAFGDNFSRPIDLLSSFVWIYACSNVCVCVCMCACVCWLEWRRSRQQRRQGVLLCFNDYRISFFGAWSNWNDMFLNILLMQPAMYHYIRLVKLSCRCRNEWTYACKPLTREFELYSVCADRGSLTSVWWFWKEKIFVYILIAVAVSLRYHAHY